jgi:hypothetical protein
MPSERPRWAWLPEIGSPTYYTMLVLIGMLVLGPLGGLAASHMNFAVGSCVNAQVMAGILGATFIDIALILWQAVQRLRGHDPDSLSVADEMRGPRHSVPRLLAFVAVCALAVMGNGISVGISDSNPISSALVVSVIVFALAGRWALPNFSWRPTRCSNSTKP